MSLRMDVSYCCTDSNQLCLSVDGLSMGHCLCVLEVMRKTLKEVPWRFLFV